MGRQTFSAESVRKHNLDDEEYSEDGFEKGETTLSLKEVKRREEEEEGETFDSKSMDQYPDSQTLQNPAN